MPQQWATPQESAGTQKFRTASGEELTDAGGIRLRGQAESGQPVLMRMRLTEVHKPLVSAHRSLKQNVVFMNEVGGALFPRDSVPGQKLQNFVNKLWDQYANLVIPLYQENGVYNLYMRPSADLSSTETASA
eukprot:436992-Amphidinium_carterae.1